MRIFCPATLAVLLACRGRCRVSAAGGPACCAAGRAGTSLVLALLVLLVAQQRSRSHGPARTRAPRPDGPGPPPLFSCPGSPVHAVGCVAPTAGARPGISADAGGPIALVLSATWSVVLVGVPIARTTLRGFAEINFDLPHRRNDGPIRAALQRNPAEGNPRSMPHVGGDFKSARSSRSPALDLSLIH